MMVPLVYDGTIRLVVPLVYDGTISFSILPFFGENVFSGLF
jgi:hypothetical protein